MFNSKNRVFPHKFGHFFPHRLTERRVFKVQQDLRVPVRDQRPAMRHDNDLRIWPPTRSRLRRQIPEVVVLQSGRPFRPSGL